MPSPSLSNLMVSPCFKLWLYIFYYYRDVDYMENRIYDERSDYAGGLKAGRRLSSGTSSNNKVIHLFVLFSSSVAERHWRIKLTDSLKFNLSGRQGGCVCVCVQGGEDDVNVI